MLRFQKEFETVFHLNSDTTVIKGVKGMKNRNFAEYLKLKNQILAWMNNVL